MNRWFYLVRMSVEVYGFMGFFSVLIWVVSRTMPSSGCAFTHMGMSCREGTYELGCFHEGDALACCCTVGCAGVAKLYGLWSSVLLRGLRGADVVFLGRSQEEGS